MNNLVAKNRRLIFYLILLVVFGYMFASNVLTPYLSDDLGYLHTLRRANNVWDVVKINYEEYLSNNSRFIDMLIYKLFLYSGNKMFSNIFNSACFVGLGLLIYLNIPKRKKYDIYIILLSFVLLFLFTIMFRQTMLWVCGTSVYLYGILWVLGFATVYRYLVNKAQIKNIFLVTIGIFLLGFCAGITNENTSGGGFLLVCIYTLNKILANKKHGITLKNTIKPYMISAILGNIMGVCFLVFSPGTQNRKDMFEEGNFQGFAGILSHAYKISVSLRNWLTPLFFIILITIVILCVQHYYKNINDIISDTGFIFLFVGIAVCYVMILIEPSVDRAYYGGSIFFMIAAIAFIQNVKLDEEIYRVLRYSLVAVMCLIVLYNNGIGLINLFRINREENERIAVIEEAVQNGENEAIVPRYRPEFETPYSTAHEQDMNEDPGFWINTYYEVYYGLERVIAIPREEWEALNGITSED